VVRGAILGYLVVPLGVLIALEDVFFGNLLEAPTLPHRANNWLWQSKLRAVTEPHRRALHPV